MAPTEGGQVCLYMQQEAYLHKLRPISKEDTRKDLPSSATV